ncbi:MAG: MBL fold metallo-hydrolase, partial [Spirochaetales bacterium]|nr:MBL fold metallo-hydrolase [Spirochaetales bacterium]
ALVYGKLVVNGAVMTGNESAGNGGAVHVSGNGDFRIYSGRIKGNRAHNGGGVSVEGNASATISNGEITGNNAGSDGNGGNLYIGSCSQGVLLGGGIDISGGMKGNEGNDISLADGSDEKPTRITLAGHFKGSSISFLGKNVRVKITADLKASVLNVASNEPFTEDERNLIIEGVHASDQYGALRFSGGRMFNDSQNVRIRFYASPIKQSQWGDATYIEFPDGTNMLVDCGSQDTGEAIARELWNLGIYRIDVVVLTHYHSDHANGLHGIFESAKISVGTFVSTSYIPKTGYAWIDEDLRVYGGSRKYVSTGDSFELGGALFSILWPDADQLSPVPDSNTTDAGGAYSDSNPPVRGGSLDMNSKTIVMMLQYGENKVLFTGDIYANRVVYNGAQNWDYSGYDNPNSEEYLVLRYEGTDVLKADIMTAPHHGKRTSSSEALIKAVSPSYAVAMGTANQKDINSRYEQFGAILYRTGSAAYDYSGTLGMNVYAVLDGSSVRVTVGEPEK